MRLSEKYTEIDGVSIDEEGLYVGEDITAEVRKLETEKAEYQEVLKVIQWATTLPPAALNDDEGFYRRELQRCIGDAARILHKYKEGE